MTLNNDLKHPPTHLEVSKQYHWKECKPVQALKQTEKYIAKRADRTIPQCMYLPDRHAMLSHHIHTHRQCHYETYATT